LGAIGCNLYLISLVFAGQNHSTTLLDLSRGDGLEPAISAVTAHRKVVTNRKQASRMAPFGTSPKRALRTAAGLGEERFPVGAFVGMISEEIQELQDRGKRDEEIDIDAQEISEGGRSTREAA